VLGSFFNGLLISWLPLFIIPSLGSFGAGASATFADTDYLIPGIVVGNIGKMGVGALTTLIVGFTIVVIIVSMVLNARDKKKSHNQMRAA